MTNTPRCEPPPELRGRDGWHWVQFGKCSPRFAEWQAAPYSGRQPLWKDYERQQSCTPEWAAKEWGWRYLSPVATPAEVAALRAERDVIVAEAKDCAVTLAAYARDLHAIAGVAERQGAEITTLRTEVERLRAAVLMHRGDVFPVSIGEMGAYEGTHIATITACVPLPRVPEIVATVEAGE